MNQAVFMLLFRGGRSEGPGSYPHEYLQQNQRDNARDSQYTSNDALYQVYPQRKIKKAAIEA